MPPAGVGSQEAPTWGSSEEVEVLEARSDLGLALMDQAGAPPTQKVSPSLHTFCLTRRMLLCLLYPCTVGEGGFRLRVRWGPTQP